MLRTFPGNSYSVSFDISPLAYGIEGLYFDTYRISKLRSGKMKGYDWTTEKSSLYRQNKGDFPQQSIDAGDAATQW